MKLFCTILLFLFPSFFVFASDYKLEQVISNLNKPWGMSFIDNDNILVINGGVSFDKNSLKQMPLKQCETMVSRSSGTNLDIGVNVDGKNMSIEYICYGAIDCKWCEIFYIHNGSPANEFRKLVTSKDYKNKVLYGFESKEHFIHLTDLEIYNKLVKNN